MNSRRQARQTGSLLALGVPPLEEQLYRHLLARHGGAPADELARRLKKSRAVVSRGLAALEAIGFVTRTPDSVPRYFATPPDIAVETLILRRQHDARTAITELRAIDRSTDGEREDNRIVEILSPSAAGQMFLQLLRNAQSEIRCLARLPMLVSSTTGPSLDLLLQALHRGVSCRTVLDSRLLELPWLLESMRVTAAAGEQFRIASSVRFKLVVVDARVAMLPLDLSRPDGSVLLVRPSSLMDAICDLFESIWQTSTPSSLQGSAEARRAEEEREALISLLASGLNDKTIEHQLALSNRTLARRISSLMSEFGAATRFQAGWLAALARNGGRTP